MNLIGTKNEFVFKEKTKYEKGFSKFYAENVFPLIEEFNKERIDALKKSAKNCLMFFAISFILYITIYKIKMWLILLCFLLGIHFLYFLYTMSPIISYESKIRRKVYKKIFEFLGPFKYICEYEILSNADLSFIRDLGLYGNFDDYQINNLITGYYKEHRINVFNAFIQDVSSNPMDYISTRRISHWTLFDGLMIHISLNKSFLGKTYLFKKRFLDFHSSERNTCRKNNLKRIKIQDREFNSIFNTHSTNSEETECLLSEKLRSGLLSLSKLFKKPNCEIIFINNGMLICIHGYKNKFDPGFILLKNNFVNDSRRIINQMGLVFDLVDKLEPS